MGACWELGRRESGTQGGVSREQGPCVQHARGLSWERLPARFGFRSDDPTLQVCFKASFDDLELGVPSSFQLPKGRLYEGNTSDVS